MIWNGIINGFFDIITGIVNLLPTRQPIIDFTSEVFTSFNDILFDNLGLIDLFVPIGQVAIAMGAMALMMAIKLQYSIGLWLLRKIPFASIS